MRLAEAHYSSNKTPLLCLEVAHFRHRLHFIYQSLSIEFLFKIVSPE